jgi:hypothetical protein
MADEAKLGLLAGLACIVVIAVVYFQKQPRPQGGPPSPAATPVSAITNPEPPPGPVSTIAR